MAPDSAIAAGAGAVEFCAEVTRGAFDRRVLRRLAMRSAHHRVQWACVLRAERARAGGTIEKESEQARRTVMIIGLPGLGVPHQTHTPDGPSRDLDVTCHAEPVLYAHLDARRGRIIEVQHIEAGSAW
jgi:hypothetical protein